MNLMHANFSSVWIFMAGIELETHRVEWAALCGCVALFQLIIAFLVKP